MDDPSAKLIRAVKHTNDYVCATHEGALFATLFVAILDPESGQLVYLNAGHNPPLYLNSNRSELVHPSGPALGILAQQEFWTRDLVFGSGDLLFVYSDGLEDAKNKSGELFGQERLLTTMAGDGATASGIISAVDDFSGEAAQFDDLTLLCLKRI
jgi:sigma-B regulation protein RsbU (phosphoserine phosphatase)